MDTARRLYRSSNDRMIGGVASGIARHTGIDIAISRIVWGILMFLGIGIPLYLLCWLVIPREPVITISGDFEIDAERFEPARRGTTLGALVKIALLLAVGAVVAANVDRDIAIVAFVVGLAVGLYYLLRNRAQDDEASGRSRSRLMRSESNRRILGVFGGLGETLGVDPTLLRVLGGIVLIAGFGLIIPLYLLYAIVVPSRRVITI